MASPLGEKIKNLRNEKGLSLEQLAQITDSSKSYLWELENRDQANPSLEKINKLAVALAVTPEFLVSSLEPTHNRQFLERRIAYKLQEIEFRKIDRNMLDRNKRRIQAILESGQNKKFDRDIRLMAGTVLTREYQGKEYRVMATVDGQYEFDGRCYQSLSRIAKEITGTAWSGPVFFGLKSTAAKQTTGRKGAGK